jgi:methylenetetrahydrofolate--tRNA-(uracil-5-)-methyltransferase
MGLLAGRLAVAKCAVKLWGRCQTPHATSALVTHITGGADAVPADERELASSPLTAKAAVAALLAARQVVWQAWLDQSALDDSCT